MNLWHVIQTKPKKEDSVSQLLNGAGLDVLFPKIKEICYRNGLSYFKSAPLFPSYLFLRINFQEKRNFQVIKYTRGVKKILCCENKPAPISDEIVSVIQSRLNEDGVADFNHNFKKGDQVRVRRGMLKDLMGVLQRPLPQEARVQVLLNLVNYKMKVKLHWTEVEKIW